jgi:putative Mg2+ transporter-C (MgtC) family protein
METHVLGDILRLLAACAAGGLIGLERELHDKPAGFRTNIMICLGAALFTILSVRLPELYLAEYAREGIQRVADPTRIAAQIVTGVGFLGAGAILQGRGAVYGLTTAATIWTVASVGMALGAGHYFIGAAATAMAVTVLFGLSFVESLIARLYTTEQLHIKTDRSAEIVAAVERAIVDSRLRCTSRVFEKTLDGFSFDVRLMGRAGAIEALVRKLIVDERVRSLKRM